ncbi:MAG: PKD domain-containing protein [Thermoleophilia bacterium]|nr:PKD domain-containing protein [Thermoleophilia bacterium]
MSARLGVLRVKGRRFLFVVICLVLVSAGALGCEQGSTGSLSTRETSASSTTTSASGATQTSALGQVLWGSGKSLAQATVWGPLTLTPGDLENLTVRESLALGTIARDVGQASERTFVYALNVNEGRLLGTTEIPGRVYAVDVGVPYIFFWTTQGLEAHKVDETLPLSKSWSSQFVMNLGSYLYVEDPSRPDRLINKLTLAETPVAEVANIPNLVDEQILMLLYPDHILGYFPQIEQKGSSGASVYNLRTRRVVGHVPQELVSQIRAWDPDQKTLFGVGWNENQVFLHHLLKDKTEIVTLPGQDGYAVGQSLLEAGSAYLGTGSQIQIVPAIDPAVGELYVLQGDDRWYAINRRGTIVQTKEQSRVADYYSDSVLSLDSSGETLSRVVVDDGTSWSSRVPAPFGITALGPYVTSDSIAWCCSCSGLNNHGDVICQWNYQTGSYCGYTEFVGKELKVLSAQPFIVAERPQNQVEQAPWKITCYKPSDLPFNAVPDIEISYTPQTDIYAHITEVTFTCSWPNAPPELAPYITYEWEIEGEKKTGNTVSHVFSKPGSHTVTVRARVDGSTDVATKSVEVVVRSLDLVALILYEPHVVYAGITEVTFNCEVRGLTPDLGSKLFFEWDLDGTASTGQGVTRTFTKAGLRPVTVRVRLGPSGPILVEETTEVNVIPTVTLAPLYPANPATPSTIMAGGTLYRYYRAKDAEGNPMKEVTIRYRDLFSPRNLSAKSDEYGEVVFQFSVPKNASLGRIENALRIEAAFVDNHQIHYVEPPNFAIQILPLSWSTNWQMGFGAAGKIGLGAFIGAFTSGEQQAGMVVTRTKADPANEGQGSMGIANSLSGEAAVGLQENITKFRLGTFEGKVVEAQAKLAFGVLVDFATLFGEPEQCSISEKIMAALTLLVGVEHCLSGGTTALLTLAENALVAALSSDVQMQNITGGLYLRSSGEAAAVNLELARKGSSGSSGGTDTSSGSALKSISGLSFLKLGGGAKAFIAISAYPSAGEVGGKAGVEVSGSFSVAEALGYPIRGYSAAQGFSVEVISDVSPLALDRVVLAVSNPPDASGECQETRLVFSAEEISRVASAIVQQLKPFMPGQDQDPNVRVFFSKEFCSNFVRNVVNAVTQAQIPYERTVLRDKNPTTIEVGLGLSVAGNEVDLAVKPTWGRYQSFPLERGLFVLDERNLPTSLLLGRLVKLEEYPASLFSEQVDTLGNVLAELLAVVADILEAAWDVASGALSSAADTVISVGAGIGSAVADGATAIFEAGTSLFSQYNPAFALQTQQLAATGNALTDTTSSLWAAAPQRVTMIGASGQPLDWVVGGIYTLTPEAGMLSKPATLRVTYSSESLGNRDPASLRLYHLDPQLRLWRPVEASHDALSQTFTAKITQMGAYCIGTDAQPPQFVLISPSGTPALVTTAQPQFIVGCVEEGSGVVPESFRATLDGASLEASWSAKGRQAVLQVKEPLAPGPHTLAVSGRDGAGNSGSATFEIQVVVPPATPELAVTKVDANQVTLAVKYPSGESAAQKTSVKPASYQIWRTDPGPGLSYHRVATLPSSAEGFEDTEVQAGQTYQYVAVALSETGLESAPSSPVTVTVPEGSGSTLSTTPSTHAGSSSTVQPSTGGEHEKPKARENLRKVLALAGFGMAAVALIVGVALAVMLRRRR